MHANDREGLERLCRYGTRGALALERFEQAKDGRIAYRMKRPMPGVQADSWSRPPRARCRASPALLSSGQEQGARQGPLGQLGAPFEQARLSAMTNTL